MTRVILPAVLTATFVFLLAPIVVVVLASFNGVGVLSFPPRAFTTRWYSEIDPSFYRALWVSLVVGVITVILAVLVGVPGALGLARGRFPGRDAINAFCLSPLMVPALVTGVALFQFSLVFWDLFGVTHRRHHRGLGDRPPDLRDPLCHPLGSGQSHAVRPFAGGGRGQPRRNAVADVFPGHAADSRSRASRRGRSSPS